MRYSTMAKAACSMAAVLALGACSTLTAPGAPNRPVLSDAEAAKFTQDHYFAVSGPLASPKRDLWKPVPIETSKADFVVGAGGSHATIQKAVNAAIAKGGKDRLYIKVLPGTYTEAVYVPVDAPQITIYGAGKAEEVKIQLTLGAQFKPAEYAKAVNPSAQFAEGDPAWNMFNICSRLPAAKAIDTPCAALFWVQSEGFQLKNLTITNTLLDSVDAGSQQAVALRSDGDRLQLESVRLIGRQDTFFVNAGEAPTETNKQGAYPTDRIVRAYIGDSYIEGDTDYVFGRANAVFNNCQFHTVSTRKPNGVVFAPDTLPQNSYGFLVMNSRMTVDAGYAKENAPKAKLGRSWDQGASKGYVAGQSPTGQLVIRETEISAGYDLAEPWGEAATSKRKFAGNIATGRNLDDLNFNRLWEYSNRY